MPSDKELLMRAYDGFNARNMEAVLATMHPDVVWATAWRAGMSMDLTASATTGRDNGQRSTPTPSLLASLPARMERRMSRSI